MYVCMYVCMHASVYIHTYIHTYIKSYKRMYAHKLRLRVQHYPCCTLSRVKIFVIYCVGF